MRIRFYNSKGMGVNGNISVFLAGPTDRDKEASPWRVSFIERIAKYPDKYPLLNKALFIIPEFCSRKTNDDGKLLYYPSAEDVNLSNFEPVDFNNIHDNFPKDRIYRWERFNLKHCTLIMFWVARDIKEGRLALTTNIEFGCFHDDRCVCGSPQGADKIDYLKYVWENERGRIWHFSPEHVIAEAEAVLATLDFEKRRVEAGLTKMHEDCYARSQP